MRTISSAGALVATTFSVVTPGGIDPSTAVNAASNFRTPNGVSSGKRVAYSQRDEDRLHDVRHDERYPQVIGDGGSEPDLASRCGREVNRGKDTVNSAGHIWK
jgi:hypothetical protein